MSQIIMGAKEVMGIVLFFEDCDAANQMSAKDDRVETYKSNNSINSQFAIWLAVAEMDLEDL